MKMSLKRAEITALNRLLRELKEDLSKDDYTIIKETADPTTLETMAILALKTMYKQTANNRIESLKKATCLLLLSLLKKST